MTPTTTQTTAVTEPILLVPTRAQIEAIHVGAMALNHFGKMAKVDEIFGRGIDQAGNAYVCFYTPLGNSGRVSNSLHEGRLARTSATSDRYTSRELDQIEARINAERASVNRSAAS